MVPAPLRPIRRGVRDAATAIGWPKAGSEAERHRRVLALGLALLGGLLVVLVSREVFPYQSLNHDEGVYLTQASMLLEGHLTLDPPVPEAFRPWFFVADGSGGYYPKYAPVPAVIFAVGGVLGWFRLALGLVAAGTIGLTYATVAEAFDRRVGVAAAGLVLASPLFLVQAATFLPYVPTLFLNLCFAWALLRADRTGSDRLAILAGVAVGLAFFARPYTTVLFATPFVALVLWRLRRPSRARSRRTLLTAAPGVLGVVGALAYNAVLTGDPLTFPYEAFAPRDGLGFGTRRLLSHEVDYTPALALRAGIGNVLALLGRWTVAAPLGGLLAAGGVVLAVRRPATHLDARRLAIAGLFITVPVGGLYFWGTLNVLGDLDRAGDGLIGVLGPYYHLDLLVPLAAFGGFFLVRCGEWLVPRLRALEGRHRRVIVATGLLVVAAVAAVATGGAIAAPLEDNAAVTDAYER
ncbi:MAG: glycosyltransferase family 39 protein, partial [Haloarculaceae archaeon]